MRSRNTDRTAWLGRHLYAHRGFHGHGRVENSPSAFTAAISAGLGIECDVQVSADGQAMVFHDWDLARLTSASGYVRDRDAAALGALQLASSGDRIWILDRLLGEVAGRVPLLIEVKSRREVPFQSLCRAVATALRDYPGPAAVMSFDPRVPRWFGRHAPQLVRGLVVTEEGSRGLRGSCRRVWALRHSRAEFLAYDIRDLPSRFAAAQRRRGLPLLTWTVSDEARLQSALSHADAPIAEGPGLEAALARS